MNNKILMISAGMERPKKDFNEINKLNLYLNYGILGLATLLYEKGYEVNVFQGDYKQIDQVIEEIKLCDIDILALKYPVFISIPSFFALSWAIKCINKLKELNDDLKIIVGGRWIVDNNLEWLKSKIKKVDLFVKGCGENYIEECLDEKNWPKIETYYDKDITIFNKFNYKLLYNYKLYQPCIEVSRGCGRGCKFCVENNIKSISNKKPEQIINEAKEAIEQYGSSKLNFYFQASIFNPTIEWAESFSENYKKNHMEFKWRFETRVDTLNDQVISILSKVGLKVIDLGLESASTKQLLNMNKTKDIVIYLEKAEKILRNAYQNNVWIKLNILLYPGEELDTINETLNWLNKNKKFIKGLSINPLILYRNGQFTKDFIKHIEILSNKKVNIEEIEKKGYAFLELSENITIEDSKILSLDISKKFMNFEDYYDLKSISYFPRNVNIEILENMLNKHKVNSDKLPFRWER